MTQKEMQFRLSEALKGTAVLAGFTLFAVAGYYAFVVPPHGPTNLALLSERTGFSWILAFYSASFKFFAQAHILIGAVVLAVFLIRKTGARWLKGFVVVYVLSLGFELLGTSTGLPFGHYSYSTLLGARWLGLVPLLIPVSWFLMAFPAYVISSQSFQSRTLQILFGAALLTAWDLALDPAMSYLTNYWIWGDSGAYYGMPIVNLAGWYVTSMTLMVALRWTGADRLLASAAKDSSRAQRSTSMWMWTYYIVTLALPVGMIAVAGLWFGSLVTCMVVGALFILSQRQTNNVVTADAPKKQEQLSVGESVFQAVPTNLQRYFENHSRSFSFAARFFDAEERAQVTRLYAFCRVTDDLVDEPVVTAAASGNAPQQTKEDQARATLHEWKTLVRSSFDGVPSGLAWLDTLMKETRDSGVGFGIVEDLFAGVESDLNPVRIQTEKDLDEYAYRVGSVVGIWMCYLQGIRNPTVLNYAADLGRAMQITNILRDVGEDLDIDRIYLPAELLSKYGITITDLREMRLSGRPSPSYVSLIRYLMAVADQRYDRAGLGLVYLSKSSGLAAAVASGVYRGIHREISRNKYDNLTQRASTSSFRKFVLAARCWGRLGKLRKEHHLRLEANRSARQAERLGTKQMVDGSHA